MHLPYKAFYHSHPEMNWHIKLFVPLNPLSPSIHIQILQTDLHTFPLRIS